MRSRLLPEWKCRDNLVAEPDSRDDVPNIGYIFHCVPGRVAIVILLLGMAGQIRLGLNCHRKVIAKMNISQQVTKAGVPF